jgi:hypothetical protein
MDPFGSVVFIGDDGIGMGFAIEDLAIVTATHVLQGCTPKLFRGGDPGRHLIPVRTFRARNRARPILYRAVFADVVSDVAVLVSRDSAALPIERGLSVAEISPSNGDDRMHLLVPTQSGRIARYRAHCPGLFDAGLFAIRKGGWSVTFGDSGAPVLDESGRAVALVSARVGSEPKSGRFRAGIAVPRRTAIEAYFALLGPVLPNRLRPNVNRLPISTP